MSKETLHELIDNVDEAEYELLGQLLLKFVKTAPPLPDELESIKIADQQYADGEYINAKNFDW